MRPSGLAAAAAALFSLWHVVADLLGDREFW